eukprot:TRINITY_DN23989_c0_g1_i1.p1 TRINITY_DN23989_c0_g1~~TRINITY_DN23989_c0_g1_i1.p1  ORF type:complete len:1196 (-),score=191.65 TRINITY_DN23989_c0_g1_i1:96-3683(-)
MRPVSTVHANVAPQRLQRLLLLGLLSSTQADRDVVAPPVSEGGFASELLSEARLRARYVPSPVQIRTHPHVTFGNVTIHAQAAWQPGCVGPVIGSPSQPQACTQPKGTYISNDLRIGICGSQSPVMLKSGDDLSQDSFMEKCSATQCVYALMDGHGDAGHLVSASAMARLEALVASGQHIDEAAVSKFIRDTDAYLRAEVPGAFKSGCTFTGLVVDGSRLMVFNLGDSRTVLRWRQGSHAAALVRQLQKKRGGGHRLMKEARRVGRSSSEATLASKASLLDAEDEKSKVKKNTPEQRGRLSPEEDQDLLGPTLADLGNLLGKGESTSASSPSSVASSGATDAHASSPHESSESQATASDVAASSDATPTGASDAASTSESAVNLASIASDASDPQATASSEDGSQGSNIAGAGAQGLDTSAGNVHEKSSSSAKTEHGKSSDEGSINLASIANTKKVAADASREVASHSKPPTAKDHDAHQPALHAKDASNDGPINLASIAGTKEDTEETPDDVVSQAEHAESINLASLAIATPRAATNQKSRRVERQSNPGASHGSADSKMVTGVLHTPNHIHGDGPSASTSVASSHRGAQEQHVADASKQRAERGVDPVVDQEAMQDSSSGSKTATSIGKSVTNSNAENDIAGASTDGDQVTKDVASPFKADTDSAVTRDAAVLDGKGVGTSVPRTHDKQRNDAAVAITESGQITSASRSSPEAEEDTSITRIAADVEGKGVRHARPSINDERKRDAAVAVTDSGKVTRATMSSTAANEDGAIKRIAAILDGVGGIEGRSSSHEAAKKDAASAVADSKRITRATVTPTKVDKDVAVSRIASISDEKSVIKDNSSTHEEQKQDAAIAVTDRAKVARATLSPTEVDKDAAVSRVAGILDGKSSIAVHSSRHEDGKSDGAVTVKDSGNVAKAVVSPAAAGKDAEVKRIAVASHSDGGATKPKDDGAADSFEKMVKPAVHADTQRDFGSALKAERKVGTGAVAVAKSNESAVGSASLTTAMSLAALGTDFGTWDHSVLERREQARIKKTKGRVISTPTMGTRLYAVTPTADGRMHFSGGLQPTRGLGDLGMKDGNGLSNDADFDIFELPANATGSVTAVIGSDSIYDFIGARLHERPQQGVDAPKSSPREANKAVLDLAARGDPRPVLQRAREDYGWANAYYFNSLYYDDSTAIVVRILLGQSSHAKT